MEVTAEFSISKGKLKLQDNDKKGRGSKLECSASSGTGEMKDVGVENVGPLPPGEYEIYDRGQYVEFLNAVAQSDPNDLFIVQMEDVVSVVSSKCRRYCAIRRTSQLHVERQAGC